MFRHLYQTIRISRLAQAGVILVILGGIAQAVDDLGAVDLGSVPYVGHYAPAIMASLGVLKVGARLGMFLITGLSVSSKSEDKQCG